MFNGFFNMRIFKQTRDIIQNSFRSAKRLKISGILYISQPLYDNYYDPKPKKFRSCFWEKAEKRTEQINYPSKSFTQKKAPCEGCLFI